MSGAVFLEGEKIELRTVEKNDRDFIRDNVNRPEYRRNLFGSKPENSSQIKENFIEEFVEEKENPTFIVTVEGKRAGLVALREEKPYKAEIGIWITDEKRRNGFGKEAVELALEYSFNQLNHHRIFARILETNNASIRMFENLGFTREGTERDSFYAEGEYQDVLLLSILEDERS